MIGDITFSMQIPPFNHVKRTSSLSFLALFIFLLQINGHLMKRNSTRSESFHQVFRGGRAAHVIGN